MGPWYPLKYLKLWREKSLFIQKYSKNFLAAGASLPYSHSIFKPAFKSQNMRRSLLIFCQQLFLAAMKVLQCCGKKNNFLKRTKQKKTFFFLRHHFKEDQPRVRNLHQRSLLFCQVQFSTIIINNNPFEKFCDNVSTA